VLDDEVKGQNLRIIGDYLEVELRCCHSTWLILILTRLFVHIP
jgi:hypothetical protein